MEPAGRCKAVSWFPVGYKVGVGPNNRRIKPFQDRTIELFFSGLVGDCGERRDMMAAIGKLPAKATDTGVFNGGGTNTYRAYMEEAKFALCPRGSNDDSESMRLYEALELGAIPITLEHDYILQHLGCSDLPFIFLKSWGDLGRWYADEIMAPGYVERMSNLQLRASRWWKNFQADEKKRMARFIDRAFERA